MTWRACEILNDPSGKPVLRLSGELQAWFTERSLIGHVTISDESGYASTFVVIESKTT